MNEYTPSMEDLAKRYHRVDLGTFDRALAAHDAATREAVLVEVAEWHEEKERIHWIKARETPGGTNSRQRLDLIAATHRLAAERFRALTAHTPQNGPLTWHRATQSASASDWSSESSAPLLAAHDGFVKVAAKMTMTTTEMAARNAKTRKDAHALDVAGYAAGCPHCPDGHKAHQPWAAWVRPNRDRDAPPVSITVMPSAGAHVAESDAEWIRELLNHHDLDADHAVALERESIVRWLESRLASIDALAARVDTHQYQAEAFRLASDIDRIRDGAHNRRAGE